MRNACLDAAPADCATSSPSSMMTSGPSRIGSTRCSPCRRRRTPTSCKASSCRTMPRQAPAWMREGHYHEVGPFDDGAPLTMAPVATSSFAAPRSRDRRALPCRLQPLRRRGRRLLRTAAARRRAAWWRRPAPSPTRTVPHERMTLAWILRRRYRTGHTLGMIARRRGQRSRRVSPKPLAALGVGVVETCVGRLCLVAHARRARPDQHRLGPRHVRRPVRTART